MTNTEWINKQVRASAQVHYKKSSDYRWIGEKWAYGKFSGTIHETIVECIGIEMDHVREYLGEDSARAKGNELCSVFTLEWPFEKSQDPGRVIYFRSKDDGQCNKTSEMNLGAYITKHFPEFTGSQVETLVRTYANQNKLYFAILTDAALVESMYNTSAHSCMHPCQGQWPDHQYHPYAAYTSRLGWAMAVRTDAKGFGQSRAIIRPGDKTFIRIYGSDAGKHTTVGDDPSLRQWLIDQGYKVVASWEGKYLERITIPGKNHNGQSCYVGPYLDGNIKKAKLKKDDASVIVIAIDGNWDMANTSGFSYCAHPDREGMVQTYNGAWVRPEDVVSGIHDRIYLRSEVTYVERRHNYIPSSDCVTVNGITEYTGDCAHISCLDENMDHVDKWILNITEDQVIRFKDGSRTYFAAKEDLAVDYHGDYQYKKRLITMTAGQFKGKLALVTRTCTRTKDGAIVLVKKRLQVPHGVWVVLHKSP